MCDFSRMQLKSHVIAPCAAASHAIFIACNKNRTDQTSLILSHAIARICILSQRCSALVQCDNCHNQSQTYHKSHDKWNMAASGVVWTPFWIKWQVIAVCGFERPLQLRRNREGLRRPFYRSRSSKNKTLTQTFVYQLSLALYIDSRLTKSNKLSHKSDLVSLTLIVLLSGLCYWRIDFSSQKKRETSSCATSLTQLIF